MRAAAMTPLVGSIGGMRIFPGGKDTSKKAKVVLIRDENVMSSSEKLDPAVVQNMLDNAVMTLFGEKDPLTAWKRVVTPTDILGIKSNEWPYLPTPPELEQAINKRVLEAGVSEKNISINDQGVRRDAVFQKATALINVRPARSHHWSGMGGCLKNAIMFTPRPSDYHGDSCADMAKFWFEYNLKERTRLNILVMFTPLFHGIGPHHYSKKYVWAYKGLLVSQDPVAVDAVGLRIMQAKRKEFFGEDKPLVVSAKHIALAETRHHLGVSDPQKIELIKLGWKDGILI